jgi:UDP-N-acetylmuramate dehydrogenase
MKIFNDFSLKQFNTFGLNVNCDAFVEVEFAEEIYSVNKMFELNSAKHLIVGQGSNILFTKDFDGIVIHPVFNNCRIKNQNKKSVLIEVEAGKNWNEFVQFTVSNNIWGIENLISIPGLAGAAPIQNIGAYGQEVKNVIEYVQFFDFADGLFKIYENSLCKFDYRNSIFKNELNGKGLIISIEFRLSKTPKPILDYGNVKDEILKSGIINPSIVQIATTISNIRSKKLPDTDKFRKCRKFF